MNMSFKLTWKSHVICILISVILVFIMNPIFDEILSYLFYQNIIYYPTNNLIVNFCIYIMVLMVPISIVHEGVHGIAYKLFGGKVKYGFKGIYAYTMEVSGKKITRLQFLIVLLGPLIVISILSLLLPVFIGGMIFFLNIIGASGDIYMALFLCRFSYDSRIIDRSYGFDVLE
ncbi:hypothetical protein DIC82_17880 [Clostridium beijerinckii]|nr:hypothetical protein DIC82_17880 [Clostridium beijerinckii]